MIRFKSTYWVVVIMIMAFLYIYNVFNIGRVRISQQQKVVIIYSYMRSGSTHLAGKILDFYADQANIPAFYLHEPTNPFYDKVRPGIDSISNIESARILDSRWTDTDGKTTTYDWTSPFTRDIFDALRSCDFLRLEALSWLDHATNPKLFMLGRSRVIIDYLNCSNIAYMSLIKTKTSEAQYERRRLVNTMRQCINDRLRGLTIENLEHICRSNPVKVVKFVRGRMQDYVRMAKESFLEGNATTVLPFKMIHLIRDPRAIIHSRLKLHWDTIEPLRLMARKLCNLMVQDYNQNSYGYVNFNVKLGNNHRYTGISHHRPKARFNIPYVSYRTDGDERKKSSSQFMTAQLLNFKPQIMLIKYEDLVYHPDAITQRFSAFLESFQSYLPNIDHLGRAKFPHISRSSSSHQIVDTHEFDDNPVERYSNNDRQSKGDNSRWAYLEDAFNTFRKDPLSHVDEWRHGLSPAQKITINSECGQALKLYKYH